MPERHAAVYARVSSKSQDLRSQEPDLKRWVSARKGPVRWYSDKATGATMSRPGWDALMADARAGLVDTVVVWRLDRLGRTVLGALPVLDELRRLGVELVSLREGIDFATPIGMVVTTVLMSFAQFEREVRAERQAAGIAAAKAKGVRFGPAKGTGGRPSKVTPELKELILRLHREGRYVASIARMTALSRTTIYSVLNASDNSVPGSAPCTPGT